MSTPLRFCMITTFYPPYNFGGDGVFVHRLSNELARRGHTVHVIHCLDSYRFFTRGNPAEPADDHPNVTVHRLKSPFGFLSPLATHQTGLPLLKGRRIREILDLGFDVIHYHNISLVGGPGLFRYGRAVKLCTLHDYWMSCPTSLMLRFNRAACARPHCVLCTLASRRPPQLWRYTPLLRRAAKHVDAFLAATAFPATVHRRMGFDAPITVMPYFVPSPESSSSSSSSSSSIPARPYFLVVARLEPCKGVQTLIPVFRRYPRADLLVVGTGGYESELHRLAAGADNIRFLGRLPDSQLQQVRRGATAVLVPSLCFETCALVTLEAFSQGVPAIVRDLGAMPEPVRESGGGLVYETDSQLLDAMNRLLDEPGLRDELGRNALRAFQERWSPDAHIARYLALIRDLAARRAQSACLDTRPPVA